MTSEGSKTRIKWEGDSNKEIRSWPEEVRQNVGLELHRLDNHEEPLDSEPMGKSAPGISELRDEHMGVWYRLLYALHAGWIYVLHCFKKKTNQTPQHDLELAQKRLKLAKQRNDQPFAVDGEEEEKSA
jgi:phage-related protein